MLRWLAEYGEPGTPGHSGGGGTRLSFASLRSAQLEGVDLSRAELDCGDLSHAHLSDTNVSGAFFDDTVLADIDLSPVKGLETVFHIGPSTIDLDTIYRSKACIPKSFLRGCGVLENFITYMKSLTGVALDFYSFNPLPGAKRTMTQVAARGLLEDGRTFDFQSVENFQFEDHGRGGDLWTRTVTTIRFK